VGYKVFILCLRQVLNNWKMAVRLSWFWLLVIIFGVISQNSDMLTRGMIHGVSGTVLGAVVLALLILAFLVVGTTAVAIGWHRYVLREEIPASFYVLRREWPLGKYIWTGFKIIFVTLLVIYALMFVMTSILNLSQIGPVQMTPGSDGQMKTSGASLIFQLVPLVTIIISTWIFLRLGAALPAVAVGENASIRDSFRLTNAISGSLLITAVLMVLFQFIPAIVQILIEMIVGPGTFLTTLVLPVFSGVFTWFSFFIGFGVLTVIYGHLAENKPI